MDNQEDAGYIKLISYVQPTVEERNDPGYIPQLEINPEAIEIIMDQFPSPISILVYIGRMGIGKSKLASLTVATLQSEKHVTPLSLFPSGQSVSNVTYGIWMWRTPLEDLNSNNKKGSILLLDCEGMSNFDKNRSANLYLFCMIISTAFAVILRPPRADPEEFDRLYDALYRFEQMQTPSVLPNVWLVPLDLPHLKHDNKTVTPSEWVEQVFSLNESHNTLPTTDTERVKAQYNYIQNKLPRIGVVNINKLPNSLTEDNLKLNDMFTSIHEQSCEDYYNSLKKAVDHFLKVGGKRLPGSTSNLLFIRPGELAQFMIDLINVINRSATPNPDELIGQYLLARFNDGIVTQKKVEFEKELLLYAGRYAKENLQQKETETEKEEANTELNEKRNRLTEQYIADMIKLAEEKIYGRNSILLTSDLFRENLNRVKQKMNQYRDPELLIEEIRSICHTDDQSEQVNRQNILSEAAKKKLDRLVDLILREERINESINRDELKVDLEQCSKCQRAAATLNLIHAKEDCGYTRHGNYYRYNNEPDQMVCDVCRTQKKISEAKVKCTKCGRLRHIIRIH